MSRRRSAFLRMVCLVLIIGACCRMTPAFAASNQENTTITEWKMKWVDSVPNAMEQLPGDVDSEWMTVRSNDPTPTRPPEMNAAWIKFDLPKLPENTAVLHIKKMYAMTLKVYINKTVIYESHRNYLYDSNTISVPLNREFSGQTVSIWLETSPYMQRLGIAEPIAITNFIENMNDQPINVEDQLLGGGILALGLTALICGLLQGKMYRRIWIQLGLILFFASAIVIISPQLGTSNELRGHIFMVIYDTCLSFGLLMLTVFFETLFGVGIMGSIRFFRRFQTVYSTFCLLISVMTMVFGVEIQRLYLFFTVTMLGIIIITQLILLIGNSIHFVCNGQKEAMIFAAGFFSFAVIGLGELMRYYMNGRHYQIHFWKWGLLIFILSLMIIVGQKVASNYRQLVKYSKELELFNNELQRSEKMDIISELAASVAHEVRNPLQVTRGFLQLLDGKYSSPTDTTYVKLALNELDRASGIITDFLTFAKPGIEDVVHLNLAKEFEQVENILQPLAHLQGGRVNIEIADDLYTLGNASKFKQAIVNIVKNSIEAFREEGNVDITARASGDDVVISVKDNGEGMEPAEIARLGEPYFSNKSKGTGLGLMVTFRIIEAMKGSVQFKSQKGKGTEAIIRLPMVSAPPTAPNDK